MARPLHPPRPPHDHIERDLATGVVMERKKREAMENVRLPASFYDVSAL